jgi:hypothetical protein
MGNPADEGRGDSSRRDGAAGVHGVPLRARGTRMRGVSNAPNPPTPGVRLQRRIVEAGLLACAAGFVMHRLWQSIPTARVGETILLGVLWLALAWLLRRLPRLRMAEAIAVVGVAALLVMAGPLPVLATCVLALAAIAIGTSLVDDAATAFVIGCALIAGIAGWLLPLPVHRAWTYLPVLLGVIALRRHALRSSLSTAMRDLRAAVDASPRVSAAGMLALGLASAGAWLPTLQYDDLAYHLGLPWQLMLDGRYALDASQQVWALAPWAGDVLQGIVHVAAHAEARGALDAAWLVACATLAFRTTTQLGAPAPLRWLAVALLATLPPVAVLVGGMQTELPAAAAMLALLAVALAPGARGWLAVAVLAGLLGGLKAIHLPAAIALVAFAAARAMRGIPPSRLILAVPLFLAVGGSSYVYAWSTCGNPLLPLLNGVFRSPCFAPVDFTDARWLPVPGVPLPWSMTFMTRHHLEGWDGGLGLLLVAFAGVAIAALASRRTRLPMACALVAIASPMLLIAYARYVVPGIVLAIPAAVATVARLYPGRRAAWLLCALCIADLLFQANAGWLLHTGGIKRALAAGGRDTPLFDRYAPERTAIAALRERYPSALVLDMGGAAHAELGGRGRTTTWYAPALHTAALAADRDASGVAWASLLRRERIGIVVLRGADATPARRAGLARTAAHVVLTRGPVECWALPLAPTP